MALTWFRTDGSVESPEAARPNSTHRCSGFLRCRRPVHRGRAVACRTGVEWGTGRAESWARGRHPGEAEGGQCPDLKPRRWSRRVHGETDGSCLRERERRKNWLRL